MRRNNDGQAPRSLGEGTIRGTTAASRPRIGRSGPRSRSGCVICKQRRVRCDEAHPVCGNCGRLQLDCYYKPQPQRWRRQQGQEAGAADEGESPPRSPLLGNSFPSSDSRTVAEASLETNIDYPTPPSQRRGQRVQDLADSYNILSHFGFYPRSGQATPTQQGTAGPSWAQTRRFDVNDIFSDLNTSWAGEFSCVLGDMGSPPNSTLPIEVDNAGQYSFMPADGQAQARESIPKASSGVSAEAFTQTSLAPKSHRPGQPQPRRLSIVSLSSSYPELRARRASNGDSTRLIHMFQKIVQPPAAILIGGFERWRRLQRYLCKLSDQSRAVNSSLLCVIELLMVDETTSELGEDKEACMKRILQRHADACEELERKLAKHAELKPKTREHLLAAIFLLSWFEVIRDQDCQSSLFPRDLADTIIAKDTSWNRHSQQLLSWLNTLDSKAAHLGGEHLLPPASLEVVSHYPTQITSEQFDDAHDKEQEDSEISWSNLSPGESHYSPEDLSAHLPGLRLGKVKHILLNTILQPALEWYLTTQSYCRRISAHDKHHRKRFTSDDEYEVITACKQLESELFELWDYRPAIISLNAEQLAAIVSRDIAIRLEEIFSVYLASFWILFVYLHRVSWWNLPHSALTGRALDEVWQHMKQAYGEEVNGPLRRIIHPSLLWPLFLFGSECPDPSRRTWAIEQLEALGEAKPALHCDVEDIETLPPFKLGSGATRNAKRAAVLLRELTKQQDEKKMRVDDRDLSMKMFGCYFSIV